MLFLLLLGRSRRAEEQGTSNLAVSRGVGRGRAAVALGSWPPAPTAHSGPVANSVITVGAVSLWRVLSQTITMHFHTFDA